MVYFPLAKLGFLLVKQIAKPITRILKQTATSNEKFRKYIVAPPAQIFHWIGVRSKMQMLGMNQPSHVPPLNKAMAIEMGSDLLSEIIVLTIGVSLIVFEFTRQARKDKLKHDDHKAKRLKLFGELEELKDRVNGHIREIEYLKVKLKQLVYKMVLGVFPLGKVAIFGIKQIAKPVANVVLMVATRNVAFRKMLCAPAGQLMNWLEVRCKMYMLRLPQPKRVPGLREDVATDIGSKLIAEVFVLTSGLYFIWCEVSR
ncbi:hypothetical protein KR093_002813 [Drosophila rubida]|uniref:OPA3-like protein CG13603 n=1 Tax=Drosophila rubida TaxID=30044 RepID=A0AAD4KGD8_9MUSC|nr:hypothetical protein KR093_002813 [Drosophila rubida]